MTEIQKIYKSTVNHEFLGAKCVISSMLESWNKEENAGICAGA